MYINEIFTSLQGEGYHTGTTATFIRFAGCNLRCPFCDTDFRQGVEMSEDDIVDRVDFGTMVILTGGEPSLQLTDSLITKLHDKGCYVAVETNGTHVLPKDIDWVTCSPKEDATLVLGQADEVKVVYTGQNVERWRERIKAAHYFLQPCDTSALPADSHTPSTEDTVRYILDHPWWRLSLQTHKLINIK